MRRPGHPGRPRISAIVIAIAIVVSFFVGLAVGAALRAGAFPLGCIAQIDINGEISFANRARELAALVREADNRADVRGILVTINSPGGSVVAAKELWAALNATRKPTWVHISDAALSGGYFVAVGGDKIWADSTSLTGGIGARTTVVEVSELLTRLGINATTIKSGELKDIADPFKPLTPKEREILQAIIGQIAHEFKETVAAARASNPRFSREKFEALDARILTGSDAHGLGLVDELGSYSGALSALGVEVGLGERPAVCEFRPTRNLLSLIFGALGEGVGAALIEQLRSEGVRVRA